MTAAPSATVQRHLDECEAQGFDRTITDPGALEDVATVLARMPRKPKKAAA